MWSPGLPSSFPRKNQLKPTSYKEADEAKVDRWPPMPSAVLLALMTIAAAFHRINARMRRSMCSSPGNQGWSSVAIVLR